MLHTVRRVTGPMLWADLHLVFWLSLVPFTTHWMGANHFAPSRGDWKGKSSPLIYLAAFPISF